MSLGRSTLRSMQLSLVDVAQEVTAIAAVVLAGISWWQARSTASVNRSAVESNRSTAEVNAETLRTLREERGYQEWLGVQLAKRATAKPFKFKREDLPEAEWPYFDRALGEDRLEGFGDSGAYRFVGARDVNEPKPYLGGRGG